jgi:hypothetical protein
MQELCKKHEDLADKFRRFQRKQIKNFLQIPLDYMINFSTDKGVLNCNLPREYQELTWRLRNIQKNVVLKRIFEIRAEKLRPGLIDAIQIHLQQKTERDQRIRKKLKNKIMKMYEEEVS